MSELPASCGNRICMLILLLLYSATSYLKWTSPFLPKSSDALSFQLSRCLPATFYVSLPFDIYGLSPYLPIRSQNWHMKTFRRFFSQWYRPGHPCNFRLFTHKWIHRFSKIYSWLLFMISFAVWLLCWLSICAPGRAIQKRICFKALSPINDRLSAIPKLFICPSPSLVWPVCCSLLLPWQSSLSQTST